MSHWDPLDVDDDTLFGVFWNEDYSARPSAIFRERGEADEWIRARIEHADEDKRVHADHYTVMEVRRLVGITWNSYEPAPAETPTQAEVDAPTRKETDRG